MTFKGHTSCDACGSSDANAVYEDNTYCYACQTWAKREDDEGEKMETKPKPVDLTFIDKMDHNGFRDRGITKAVAKEFGVKSVKDADGEVTHHYYPYTKGGKVAAYKERVVDGKQFRTLGEFKEVELFGQSVFPEGGRKIIVTEGEIDAMVVAQAHVDRYGSVYPVVSIPNGASALTCVHANRSYLRSFQEVILMMDSDAVGLEAQSKVAKIIGPDKVKIAKLRHKDASDAYQAEGKDGIMSAVWNAQDWCPAGIVNSAETWDMYAAEQDAVYTPYPSFVSGLNSKIYGRRLGSITTFTSGTGSGKTSFLREDMYHLLQTTDSKIGVCSLEESVAETVRGFISLDLSKRVGLPGVDVSVEDQRGAFDRTLGTGRFEILDHQGSVSDDSLLEKLEYMACVCDYIYLDHITIAISEVDGSVNAAMDKFMSELLKMAKRHNVWFGVVSHLRKSNQDQKSFEQGAEINEDSLKGSGSLKQISAQIIALERNKNSEDMSERHTVKVRVLKDRFGGDTGTAARYKFDFETGRLREVTENTGFEPLEELNV
jgi:twinkle protein